MDALENICYKMKDERCKTHRITGTLIFNVFKTCFFLESKCLEVLRNHPTHANTENDVKMNLIMNMMMKMGVNALNLCCKIYLKCT